MPDQTQNLAQNKVKDEAIQNILEFLPKDVEMPVLPPTQNRWYTLSDKNKPITIRPLTYEDEKIAAKARSSGGDTLTILLDRCIDNININISMIENYLAVKYFGQSKDDIESEHLINRDKLIELGVFIPNEE